MMKRVFVFIFSLAALVSIGLVQCAGSVPYAAVSTSCLHDQRQALRDR